MPLVRVTIFNESLIPTSVHHVRDDREKNVPIQEVPTALRKTSLLPRVTLPRSRRQRLAARERHSVRPDHPTSIFPHRTSSPWSLGGKPISRTAYCARSIRTTLEISKKRLELFPSRDRYSTELENETETLFPCSIAAWMPANAFSQSLVSHHKGAPVTKPACLASMAPLESSSATFQSSSQRRKERSHGANVDAR